MHYIALCLWQLAVPGLYARLVKCWNWQAFLHCTVLLGATWVRKPDFSIRYIRSYGRNKIM